MRVAVLINNGREGGFLSSDRAYIDDAIANAQRIVHTLAEGGHEAQLVQISARGLRSQMQKLKSEVDVVFNLTESVGLGLVLKVIYTLEDLGIAYAGANEFGHKTTSDKLHMKKVLLASGIPTPRVQFFRRGSENLSQQLQFPLIVKATREHGSMSVHQDAVVVNDKQMRTKVEFLLEKYGGIPVMVEEYISGREINSTIIGSHEWTQCLPLSEVVFERSYQDGDKWPIYTYEAKYNHGTPDFDDAPARLVDWLTPDEEVRLKKLSVKVCQLTECFDYARIDFRFDEKGRIPYFIDVNSYPCLLDDPVSDTICVSRLAVGWDYLRLLEEIAQSGLRRWERSQHIRVRQNRLAGKYLNAQAEVTG